MIFRTPIVALALLASATSAFAQGVDIDDFASLSPVAAKEAMEGFRNYRASGDQRMRFTLTHAPRRGDETTYSGELCATWTDGGRLVRLEIGGKNDPAANRRRYLIVDGVSPAVYALSGGKPVRADENAMSPLLPGLVFTPYDLQLPFTHWEYRYRRTERFRGRRTDYFRMTPPESFKKSHPEVSRVELGFDHAYNALMQATTFDKDDRAMREITAETFGKIRGQWTIVEMRLRDATTRDADTLRVDTAALGITLPRSVFTPEGLAQPLPETSPDKFEKAD